MEPRDEEIIRIFQQLKEAGYELTPPKQKKTWKERLLKHMKRGAWKVAKTAGTIGAVYLGHRLLKKHNHNYQVFTDTLGEGLKLAGKAGKIALDGAVKVADTGKGVFDFMKDATEEEKELADLARGQKMVKLQASDEFINIDNAMRQHPWLRNELLEKGTRWKVTYMPKTGYLSSTSLHFNQVMPDNTLSKKTAVQEDVKWFDPEFVSMVKKKGYVWGTVGSSLYSDWDYQLIDSEWDTYLDKGKKALLRQDWLVWKFKWCGLPFVPAHLYAYTLPNHVRASEYDVSFIPLTNPAPRKGLIFNTVRVSLYKPDKRFIRFVGSMWHHRPEQLVLTKKHKSLSSTKLKGERCKVVLDNERQRVRFKRGNEQSSIPYVDLTDAELRKFERLSEVVLV